jgi:signal transduction histidine kinase
MTIRRQLLIVFALCGALPLVLLGAYDYARSARRVDALLTRQTADMAQSLASDLRDRLARQRSDLALVTDNADVQRWLEADATRSGDTTAARAQAQRFVDQAFAFFRGSYAIVRIVPESNADAIGAGGRVSLPDLFERRAIRDSSGRVLGKIEFVSELPVELRTSKLATGFGSTGDNFVFDRERGLIVLQPATASGAMTGVLRDNAAAFRQPAGSIRFSLHGDDRVASFVSVDDPAWTLVVTASLEDFAGPLIHGRFADLALLLAIVLVLALVVTALIRRATQPLTDLTAAADRVASGDLRPLPASAEATDEVGRLRRAFGIMVDRVADMLRQVESSRQMAVLGEFAAQLSHEIRNPLTAVKINMQGLARDAQSGLLPPDSARSLEIALREVDRLDGVVHGVLRMGRAPAAHTPYALHDVVRGVVQLFEQQAAARRVELSVDLAAGCDTVVGDADAMRGGLLNVMLNALEAQPNGGRIELSTRTRSDHDVERIELRVRDDGPGLTREQRSSAFRPFYTTKPQGTGLGLPLALRAASASNGTIAIESAGDRGAIVTVSLPLATTDAPVGAGA